jgi:hypothetical protein
MATLAIDAKSLINGSIMRTQTIKLSDISREPHPTPCGDCGRTYLNGENITWTVPTAPSGNRVVWSGCCDCWIRRTDPNREI